MFLLDPVGTGFFTRARRGRVGCAVHRPLGCHDASLTLCFPLQAYMEDHLKNKNRLEKEWEALCAYQAEPNSSLVAQRAENAHKNRSPAVLTCT